MSRTEGPLRFDVSIQVHAHPDGSFTLRALGPAPLVAWSTDPESVREDLELALIDRIERTHPSLLHRFQTPRGREVVRVEVGSALKLAGEEDQSSRSLDVDALVEPDLAHLRVRLPAFDASLWIGQDDDLRAAVRELVERMLEGATLPVRLERQAGSGLSLQVLPLEVEPASLEAFTGEHAGSMLLPEPVPAKTEEEKEREKRVPTPTLDRLGMEWTEHRDALVGAWGREGEVAELLRMLERPGAAVVVVGPPLAGKSAVIEQAVKVLEGRRAWFLDASRLVHAGSMAGWRGQTLAAVHELGEAEGLWLIGDPLPLLDAGKHVGSDMNVSQVLKPFLSNGQLRVLGECSEAAWGRLEAKDAGFARLFTPWRLTPPAEPRPILEKLAATLPVPVASDGVDAAMELAVRYGPRDARLGTAAHFLRRLAAEARALGLPGPLDRTDVLRRFCAETGLPEILVRDDLPLDPESVRQAFASALVGQDDAVERLVDLVAVIKGGMSDLDRPLGSFLFVGPTGVGKTEAAKALARWLFGGRGADDPRTPARLVRFDMSELSGPDCVARLLDPSAGLVAAVRRRPFSVVLLDEIEKAHPAVFDLLLQVLGEARLSDANGTVADFRNTVVLLTSNLGIGTFRRPTGFGGDPGAALQQHVLAEVERFFRPELFNRIDQVVPFASLGADAIGHIAHREVAGVARRPGLRTRGVALEVDPAAVAWLAERGVDPQYGARPLQRAVQTHLTAPLARHLSERGGAPSVRVEVGRRGLRFVNLGASTASADVDGLKGLMERLADLRYVAGCWASAPVARDARHEIALVDRLMTSKRFWADQTAATARSRALQGVRDAVDALKAAREGIAAVEDLVHEAWQDRDPADLDELRRATDEAAEALSTATLELAGCRLPTADGITLAFYPAEDDQPGFRKELIGIYLDLALQRGWTVLDGDRKWPSPEKRQSAHEFLGLIMKGHPSVKSLRFQGSHAATLLKGETGAHRLKHASSPVSVPVRAVITGSVPDDPPTQRVRLYDPGRKHLQDTATKLTTTLHNQQHVSLGRLLELKLLVGALGEPLGVRLWKAHRG